VVERLQAAGLKAVPTGIEHGTVTAVSDGQPYEVTTLRRDVETFGRRATVAFTDDWREDAARRDFTINALMADPVSGEVFDYFNGLADLEAPRPIHRRPVRADRRGSFADPALLPFPRAIRARRA
jgi:poly(A) polymerase